jgi:hypothetical protein
MLKQKRRVGKVKMKSNADTQKIRFADAPPFFSICVERLMDLSKAPKW